MCCNWLISILGQAVRHGYDKEDTGSLFCEKGCVESSDQGNGVGGNG